MQTARLASSRAFARAGSNIDINIAIIDITTSSSIRVNAAAALKRAFRDRKPHASSAIWKPASTPRASPIDNIPRARAVSTGPRMAPIPETIFSAPSAALSPPTLASRRLVTARATRDDPTDRRLATASLRPSRAFMGNSCKKRTTIFTPAVGGDDTTEGGGATGGPKEDLELLRAIKHLLIMRPAKAGPGSHDPV